MGFADLISRLSPSRRRAEKASAATGDLKANAEKALRMKRDREEATTTPPHRTSSEGLHAPHGQGNLERAREPDFTTQMGRSAGRRTSDGS
jgi:hypothetical protein